MSEYYGENPADCTSAGFFLTFGSTFIRQKVLPKSQARRFWDGRLIPSYRLNFANNEKQIYEFKSCSYSYSSAYGTHSLGDTSNSTAFMRGREVSVRPSSSSSRPSRRSGAKSSSPLLKPFDSEHVTFAIFMSESRRFFKEYNRGWHLGDNVGMMAFDMSKPCIENWKLKFGNCYCKGYGMTIGLCVSCEYRFAGRWLLAAYFGRSGWTAATTAIRTTAGSIHTPPSSRITQIPRSIRQLLGVASQQDRSLSRLPPPTTNRLTPASGDYSRGRTRSVP